MGNHYSEYTYEKWVDLTKKGGRGMVKHLDWLDRGCPACGCKGWQVTNDGWCYCDGCSRGYSTDGPWTLWPLRHYKNGRFHCFVCSGTGLTRAKEPCDECDGTVTNKKEEEDAANR